MKKFTLGLKMCLCFSAMLSLWLFSGFNLPDEHRDFIQNTLTKYHDNDSPGNEVKRFDINVTNTGFCRYRKVFKNGKEEYFAFNLSRFTRMDFYGTALKGNLYLRTKNDDVVVQTRNDRKGEVDSTGTYVVIPLKNIDEAMLNTLAEHFREAAGSIAY